MEYKEIVAISGMPGLYQLVSSRTGGSIIRSLADERTFFASSRLHQLTPLESIEVFTGEGNISLTSVFASMLSLESELKPADPATDPDSIRSYFRGVIPGMDERRVHVSDMKKMLSWFGILKARELVRLPEPQTVSQVQPPPPVAAEPEAPAGNPETSPANP